jgi:hypothetical protein
MNKISRKNNSLNKENGKLAEANQADLNSLHQEHIHQSRLASNFASTIIVISAAFCFTGIGLFWGGKLSKEAAITTVDLASRVVTSLCLPLIKSSRRQLEQLTDESEEDKNP